MARPVTTLYYCVFGSFFSVPAAWEELFKQDDENVKKYPPLPSLSATFADSPLKIVTLFINGP